MGVRTISMLEIHFLIYTAALIITSVAFTLVTVQDSNGADANKMVIAAASLGVLARFLWLFAQLLIILIIHSALKKSTVRLPNIQWDIDTEESLATANSVLSERLRRFSLSET